MTYFYNNEIFVENSGITLITITLSDSIYGLKKLITRFKIKNFHLPIKTSPKYFSSSLKKYY